MSKQVTWRTAFTEIKALESSDPMTSELVQRRLSWQQIGLRILIYCSGRKILPNLDIKNICLCLNFESYMKKHLPL